jgi:hypothetical protein
VGIGCNFSELVLVDLIFCRLSCGFGCMYE